ncbi:MAG: glycosyltransferase, partial [Acidobacteria bacterium]|nr:glycosyltransferase [Acidobacteriota bacterium]
AMAKAVVSTTIGAEGLPVKHDREVLIADSPEEFANSIFKVLSDKGLRRQLESSARELVVSKYSWAAVAEEFALTLSGACRTQGKRLVTPRP